MFRKLNYAEPAVLRGIVSAIVALAAAVGVVNTDAIEGAGEALIPAVAFLWPLLQALWTRRAVVPAEKHVDQLARAAGHVDTRTPGYPAHAAPDA